MQQVHTPRHDATEDTAAHHPDPAWRRYLLRDELGVVIVLVGWSRSSASCTRRS